MSDNQYRQIANSLENELGTTSGQMFGKPCLKINGKAFAAFFKGEMVFKLGQEEIGFQKGKYTGSVNWDPSGKNRPMKDWLQVPVEFEADWEILARKAIQFLENQ